MTTRATPSKYSSSKATTPPAARDASSRWTVANIAAGHSGGNSFGSRLAMAVAERLSLGYLQVWRDRPIKGTSHPKEFRRLPPLEMLAKPIGATLVIDDVATSGYHMWEALMALRALGIPAGGIAWISADSATIGRPDWRSGYGRRGQDAQAGESETLQAWQSGNPGGRSKAQIDVRNLAREHTKEAIDTLVLVMRNGKPGEAALAANSLLDRGWGKPAYAEPLVSDSASRVSWNSPRW